MKNEFQAAAFRQSKDNKRVVDGVPIEILKEIGILIIFREMF